MSESIVSTTERNYSFLVIVKLNSDMSFYQNSHPKQKRIDCGMKNQNVFARMKGSKQLLFR